MLLSRFVRNGDKVVDATCGNGHDTLLLAGLAGGEGHVWGFDIQQQAISETGRRVADAGVDGRVTLVRAGHEELSRHIAEPLQAVCFNLGYLPGGDRKIVTRPETTVVALEQAVRLLVPGGLVVVTVYPGHDGGTVEQLAVDGWAAELAPRHFHSWRMGQLNVPADAPYGIVVQRAT
jgi:ubiquinone/menaquinone biosynthesis C-methylase UbiE